MADRFSTGCMLVAAIIIMCNSRGSPRARFQGVWLMILTVWVSVTPKETQMSSITTHWAHLWLSPAEP